MIENASMPSIASRSGAGRRLAALHTDLPTIAVLGFAGASAIAVTSWWVGAVYRSRPAPVTRMNGVVREVVPRIADITQYSFFWIGLGVLFAAWLLLGHEVFRRADASTWRAVRRIGLLWASPLLFAAPVGSRDLWAYAAQANVVAKGLNPYVSAPAALPGSFARQVSQQWVTLPSPYGPTWVGLSGIVRIVLGAHPTLVAGALRGLAVCGFVLLAWSIPVLADRVGGNAARALWGVLASPLFLIDGVAGGHNDLLMAGLVSAALVVATSRLDLLPAMALAGGLIGLAATVKLPAVIAVPFLVMIWLRQHEWTSTPRRQIVGTGVASASCGAVCVVLSLGSGLGFGWVAAGTGAKHSGGPFVVLAIAAAVALAWERSRTWEPMAMLAAAVVTLLMVVPIAEWWYWFFPIAIAAPLLVRRITAVGLAAVCLALLVTVRPDGNALHLRPETLVAAGLLMAWAVVDRTSPRSWRRSLSDSLRER
jgi:hypothetical protein